MLEKEGILTFHNCEVKHKDIQALANCVCESATPLKTIAFERCRFDVRDDDGKTLEALRDFFASVAPSLQKVVFHTPTLSNKRVAQILYGARDSIQELSFSWSFARAATWNRHLVFQQLHQLHTLVLKYEGLEYFAEMDASDFAMALQQSNSMERLVKLEFHGWNIRDMKLRVLVDAIQRMPCLKVLHLERISELTPSSLEVLGQLGKNGHDDDDDDDMNNNHRHGLQELRLVEHRRMLDNATSEQIRSFVQSLSVQTLVIRRYRLARSVVRSLLRAVGNDDDDSGHHGSCRLSNFSLHESAFGQQEFELLFEVLPAMTLRSLEIDQFAITPAEFYHREDDIVMALRQNTSLTEFQFSGGGYCMASSDRILPILERNQRSHFVDRLLQKVSILDPTSPMLLTHAIATLLRDRDGTTDVQRLLTNRISVLAQYIQETASGHRKREFAKHSDWTPK